MSDGDKIALGECPVHGFVTAEDGATITFPTTARCHCGRELERATVADRTEVLQHV